MLISVAFIVLLVSPLSFGFVFIKQWSIKRIHTSCSPFTSLRYVCSNSIQRLHQQQSDEHDQGSAFHNTEVLERSEEEAGDDFPEVESLAEVDPVAQATIDQEKRLAEELQHLETVLKSERVSLIKVRDNLSESGKNGFFIVQAQVNDFTVQ